MGICTIPQAKEKIERLARKFGEPGNSMGIEYARADANLINRKLFLGHEVISHIPDNTGPSLRIRVPEELTMAVYNNQFTFEELLIRSGVKDVMDANKEGQNSLLDLVDILNSDKAEQVFAKGKLKINALAPDLSVSLINFNMFNNKHNLEIRKLYEQSSKTSTPREFYEKSIRMIINLKGRMSEENLREQLKCL